MEKVTEPQLDLPPIEFVPDDEEFAHIVCYRCYPTDIPPVIAVCGSLVTEIIPEEDAMMVCEKCEKLYYPHITTCVSRR